MRYLVLLLLLLTFWINCSAQEMSEFEAWEYLKDSVQGLVPDEVVQSRFGPRAGLNEYELSISFRSAWEPYDERFIWIHRISSENTVLVSVRGKGRSLCSQVAEHSQNGLQPLLGDLDRETVVVYGKDCPEIEQLDEKLNDIQLSGKPPRILYMDVESYYFEIESFVGQELSVMLNVPAAFDRGGYGDLVGFMNDAIRLSDTLFLRKACGVDLLNGRVPEKRTSVKLIDCDGDNESELCTCILSHKDGRTEMCLSICDGESELFNLDYELRIQDLFDTFLVREGGISIDQWVEQYFSGSMETGAQFSKRKLDLLDIDSEELTIALEELGMEPYGYGDPEPTIREILDQKINSVLELTTVGIGYREAFVYVPSKQSFIRYRHEQPNLDY